MSTSQHAENEEVDTIWKSEKDILRDIALLNDFGEDKPYKILYSNGRGKKINQKHKNSEQLYDSRTGEIIDISNIEFLYSDNLGRGRGRGKHFGRFSVKEFQLQEQLRLARPLGSGDEAIESYCRRNRHSRSTSDSDVDSQNSKICSQSSPSSSDTPPARVIGSRNSVLQSNALITSLLSKIKDSAITGAKENFSSDTEEDDENSKSDIHDSSNNNDGCGNNCDSGNDWDEDVKIAYDTGEKSEEPKETRMKNSSGQTTDFYDVDQKEMGIVKKSGKMEINSEVRRPDDLVPKWVTSNESVKSYCITSDEEFPPLIRSSRKQRKKSVTTAQRHQQF